MEKAVAFYSQGRKLFGDLSLPQEKAPGVILSHGLESSKDSEKWRLLAARLAEAGFASLRFNYSGCGEGATRSEGDFAATTLTGRVADFRAAAAFLKENDIDMRLGAVGSSFGGMVALAAHVPGTKALVLMSTLYRIPPPDAEQWQRIRERGYFQLFSGQRLQTGFYDDLSHYDILSDVRDTRCPVLVIHGSRDEIVPVSDAEAIFKTAAAPKQLHIVSGGNHVLNSPDYLAEVTKLSLAWLSKYL